MLLLPFVSYVSPSICLSVRPTPIVRSTIHCVKKWIKMNVLAGETTMGNLSPPFFVCFENTVKLVHKNVYVRYK